MPTHFRPEECYQSCGADCHFAGCCDPMQAVADEHEFSEGGGVNPSIDLSTTFTFMSAQDMQRTFAGEAIPEQGEYGSSLYTRYQNPTIELLGRKLAALEGTEAAFPLASGMAAITCALLQTVKSFKSQGNPRNKIVASRMIYGGTFAFLHDLADQFGWDICYFNPENLQECRALMDDRVAVLYVESLSNPLLTLPDLRELSAIAKTHGAKLIVDNTFAPLMLMPYRLGADIVVHSLTKFIGGHSDHMGGVVCCSQEFKDQLRDLHTGFAMLLGPTMNPFAAWSMAMHMETLGVRLQEESKRALRFSRALQEKGIPVVYPGLPSHPQHELFKKLRNCVKYGFGGMMTVDLGLSRIADLFMEKLQEKMFGLLAVSLGNIRTLMSASARSTSSELPEEEKARIGLTEGMVRLSIGCSGNEEMMLKRLLETLEEVSGE